MQPENHLLRLLPILKKSMIFTVLFAGGIVWYLFSQQALAVEIDAESKSYINMVFLAMIAGVALVVMFARKKIENARSISSQCGYTLVAWAAAEGIALMGTVFISWGDATYFIAGILVLIMTFFVVPTPRAEDLTRQ